MYTNIGGSIAASDSGVRRQSFCESEKINTKKAENTNKENNRKREQWTLLYKERRHFVCHPQTMRTLGCRRRVHECAYLRKPVRTCVVPRIV